MFQWFGRLLCRLDFHKWKETGLIGSLVVPCPMDQCQRCGIFRQFNLYAGYTYYTKEAVERAAVEKQINKDMAGIRNTLKDMGL